MKFLVDECTGPMVAGWLRQKGHDVFSIYDQARGMPDDEIIQMAVAQQRILITNDKDFGERIYRDHRLHRGVILLRLEDERAPSKIAVLSNLLAQYANKIDDAFVVVSERRVRFAKRG
ncbi:MAG: hypothetical protein A2Z25_06950 [Planctomycetes bacterium RBG_16_55_9]|nr:MAG: hypothetical protein A2Z25_06950 [Planctomycetes bacterium RBG_16_55_9]